MAHVEVEHPNDFLADAMKDLMKRWQQTNFEACWNELQTICERMGIKM